MLRISNAICDTLGGIDDTSAAHCQDQVYILLQAQLNAHRATIAEEDAEGWSDGDTDEGESDNVNDDNFPCDPRWEALRKLKDNN